MKKIAIWFASLPLDLVAEHSLLPGLALSSMESAEWRAMGHTWLLLAIIPIVAWAASKWWASR